MISVDTKKKELVGDFKDRAGMAARRRARSGSSPRLPGQAAGKAIPYGVYDLTGNEGWVSVGMDHDTAQFAVETIRRWWQEMGREFYPRAEGLGVTADSGGSNGSRSGSGR